MFFPENEAQAAKIILDARSSGQPLAICGGLTRSKSAHLDARGSLLSSRALTGIVDYDPAEMVMTVKAGTAFNEVKAALAANSQMMAFEPPDYREVIGTTGEPTIGGIFATNASGSRRFVAGAARDSLLGIRFVNGQGEVLRAGGRVMKNVTGLDLVKLLAGSHGTLGFLTEVTFRVLPVPPATATVVIAGLDDAGATRAMAKAMAMTVEVSGAAHLPLTVSRLMDPFKLQQKSVTLLRLEGLPASVSVRQEKLRAAMSEKGEVSLLDDEESKLLWSAITNVSPFANGALRSLWRISLAPSSSHQFVARMALEANIEAFYDWQGGLVWMLVDGVSDARRIRQCVVEHGGGHATLIRTSDDSGQSISAFQPQPEAISALSERIRQKLDPDGIFSSGLLGGTT